MHIITCAFNTGLERPSLLYYINIQIFKKIAFFLPNTLIHLDLLGYNLNFYISTLILKKIMFHKTF